MGWLCHDAFCCLAGGLRHWHTQLDGELALYASRWRFGPGPESSVKGCAAGRGIRFLRLSPPTSGLARRRPWKPEGAQLDGEFDLYASRRRLRA